MGRSVRILPLGAAARPGHTGQVTEIAAVSQRLDRWLYNARIFKTRALAGRVVSGKGARITRSGRTERTEKPSFAIRPGDTVAILKDGNIRVLEIVDIGTRRGPATEAQQLYNDHSPDRLPPQGQPPAPRLKDPYA